MNTTIIQRVRATQAAFLKQAADDGGVADPNERGGASITKDPKELTNVSMPTNQSGVQGGSDVPALATLKPSQTGANVPSTSAQQPKDDAATSPTTDIGKIASRANRVQALLSGKAAAAPAAAAPAAPSVPAGGWDPEVRTKMAVALGVDEQVIESLTPEQLGDITRDRLVKMATLALEAEGGVEVIAELLEKKAGADEAKLVIQQAVNSWGMFTKEASHEEQQAAAWLAHVQAEQAQAVQAFQTLTKNASAKDQRAMEEYNAAINHGISLFLGETPDQPAFDAYIGGLKQAAADIAALQDGQTPPGMAPEEGEMPPPGAEGMPPGAEGAEGAEGGESGGIEELLAALEQAIGEGKISQEEAAQLIQDLQGAEGEGSPEDTVEQDVKAAAAALGIV